MKLDTEGLYIPRPLGKINIPTDRTNFSRIIGGLGLLSMAKVPEVCRLLPAARSPHVAHWFCVYMFL
jgi:hypothetical protein